MAVVGLLVSLSLSHSFYISGRFKQQTKQTKSNSSILGTPPARGWLFLHFGGSWDLVTTFSWAYKTLS